MPDVPSLNNPGLTVAKNVVPTANSYRSLGSLTPYSSNSLSHRVQGAYAVIGTDSAAYNYAGDVDELYVMNGNSWEDATRRHAFGTNTTATSFRLIDSGATFTPGMVGGKADNETDGGTALVTTFVSTTELILDTDIFLDTGNDYNIYELYTTAEDEFWEFAQWGGATGNGLIATNGTDTPQILVNAGYGNFFTDIVSTGSASVPVAKHMAVVKDFVVLGDVNDGTAYRSRIQWSGINNPLQWGYSASALSDHQDLPDGGVVNRIIGGEYGVIFQENAITTMSFVGSPAVFQFNQVSKNRGTQAPQSVIKVGESIYYLGKDGFYVLNGTQSTPISTEKVNRFFFDHLDENYVYRVSAMVDPFNNQIFWAFPRPDYINHTAGALSQMVVYNWVSNRWTYIDFELTGDIDLLAIYYAQGVNMTASSIDVKGGDDLDALTPSLDSRAWTANANLICAFTEDFKLNTFDGEAMTGVIETGEYALSKLRQTFIRGVRPLIDEGGSTLEIGSRNNLRDTVAWGIPYTEDENGDFSTRDSARYHRFRLTTTGNFEFADGLEIDAVTAGGR